MISRYQGKPLLRLLECYVLDAISQLSAADRSKLELMTSKLQAVYKVDGNWRSIISQVMHFPATLDDNIRSMWARNRELAAQHGEELLAEDFARMIVDENLTNG
jgi:hypothetical protein